MINRPLCNSIFLVIFLGFQFSLIAQKGVIKGMVMSSEGDTLPYASIFSDNSSTGSSSNQDGVYSLSLKAGVHLIIAQYVGYKKFTRRITIEEGEVRTLNIQLEPVALDLSEVTIKGDRNPGLEIIKKVIARRKMFLDSSSVYEADVYIKGLFRLTDAPEKIFGRETGGIDSLLSEMGSRIIYLSETKSVYAKKGEESKEKVLASKVSGMSSTPSLNRASLIDLNFYNNTLHLISSQIKSPVADDATLHYNYRLLGTFTDPENRLINRIEVIPKRKGDPLVNGYVEIIEDQWIIKSLQLSTTGFRIKNDLIDSITIRQNFHPIGQKEVWPLIQTSVGMEITAFGFKAEGGFTSVNSNYIFSPDSFQLKMDRTMLEYTDDAMEKDSAFWLDQRPIELSPEEKTDYKRKDSLSAAFNDPERRDSLERERNKFKPMDLFSQYEYRKSQKNLRISISSPAASLLFNPVQGINFSSTAQVRKSWAEKDSAIQLEFSGTGQYGIADKTFRYLGYISFRKNEYDPFEVRVMGGQELLQINHKNPISLSSNQFSNLFFKFHFIRFYESRNLQLMLRKQFKTGWSTDQTLILEERSFVVNHSQWSIFKKDEIYPENTPTHRDLEEDPSLYRENTIVKWKGMVSYQPGIRYLEYPSMRLTIPSDLPIFTVKYNWGIPLGVSSADFFQLEGQVDYKKQTGIAGFSHWVLRGGAFLRKNELTFFDYNHFQGNEFFVSDADYIDDYLLLPYYEYSTDHPYAELHWTHDFKSYLLNKVPVIRKLGFSIVLKGSYMHHRDVGHYNEISLGIDRLGWGLFRLFRVDVVRSFQNGNYKDWGVVIGSKIGLRDLQQFIN